MPEPGQPQQISHHLLLCATPNKALCYPDPAVGAASWEALKRLVREWGLEDPARPEGIIYGGVTPERIKRILREHVMAGEVIGDWIVRRYQPWTKPPTDARAFKSPWQD